MQSDYRVLARKYRPTTFNDVIGQEDLVRSLAAGIENDRLPHAFIFHGTRGVGKTTTARVLARALNCMAFDKPTLHPCGQCDACLAIAEDRFLDVIEMDAASRTGVDDVREIIDSIKYKAVMGRYKVYIIDEVHMLSKSAFNALLKTLEEPPSHVKFIFATTEIHKVPETILSRCMRFDLKRIGSKVLMSHLSHVAGQEQVSLEADALAILTRAADGSARDGLSLLDQAIALSKEGQTISSETVRNMLGLVERGRLYEILDHLFSADLEAALSKIRIIYSSGGDPSTILQELLDILYWVVCLKTAPRLAQDESWSEQDRTDGHRIAERIPLPALMRAWQVMLQGLQEVARAPSPLQALDMIFVKLVYMADLPSPAELIDSLQGENDEYKPRVSFLTKEISYQQEDRMADETLKDEKGRTESASSGTLPETFEKLVQWVGDKREPMMYTHLLQDVHVVDYQPGFITLRLLDGAPRNFSSQLSDFLAKETEYTWIIDLVDEVPEGTTLKEQQNNQKEALKAQSRNHPLVKSFEEVFPGAKVVVEDPE